LTQNGIAGASFSKFIAVNTPFPDFGRMLRERYIVSAMEVFQRALSASLSGKFALHFEALRQILNNVT